MALSVTATREDLLVQIGGGFATLSVGLFEPERVKGTIVCLHGFAGNGHDFDAAAGPLARAGYRVVTPDLPGRGASAWLSEPSRYLSATHAQALVGIVNRYGEGPLTLLGVGWGAVMVVLSLTMAKMPLAGLVLCDLPLRWHLGADPALVEAARWARSTYETREAALAEILASSGFAGAPDKIAEAIGGHRLRQTAEGWGMAFDPAIVLGKEALGVREYDLTPIVGALPAPAVLMSAGEAVPETGRFAQVIEGPRFAARSSFLFARDEESGRLLDSIARF
jgi:pimeloyl-ACP methyl ester carboxylesterase